MINVCNVRGPMVCLTSGSTKPASKNVAVLSFQGEIRSVFSCPVHRVGDADRLRGHLKGWRISRILPYPCSSGQVHRSRN